MPLSLPRTAGALAPETGRESHRTPQPQVRCAAPRSQRHETRSSVRQNALKARFHAMAALKIPVMISARRASLGIAESGQDPRNSGIDKMRPRRLVLIRDLPVSNVRLSLDAGRLLSR